MSICPEISLPTEKTVISDYLLILLAILAGPAFCTAVLILLSFLVPPFTLIVWLVAVVGLYTGFPLYLMMAGLPMLLAHRLGLTHPVIHAAIGFAAVRLIPLAHDWGVPFVTDPALVQFGNWFGPAWCATAAALYGRLRREF